jgi:hypothetical protein
MVALENKLYAQILYGVVHWKFTKNELPIWNENDITVVDITEVFPTPEIGYVYKDGIFTEPALALIEESLDV